MLDSMAHTLAGFRHPGYRDLAVKLPLCLMPIQSLVPASWLAARLDAPRLKVLDASMYLASAGRDAAAEFRAGHIPGARYFSIEEASDPGSPLPHMMPTADRFAGIVSRLGISSGDHVVVYDASGVNFSAPRAWWMFRAFGHDEVSVLDGGLEAWVASGFPVEAGEPGPTPPGSFRASPVNGMVVGAADVIAALQEGGQVVDARSRGRFEGTEPEPRPGLRSGHMPGARSLHYAAVVDEQGLLRSPDELRALLSTSGIDPSRPVIATCGSGITACSILLALDAAGAPTTMLYDGSWTEWGQRADFPVEQGPARTEPSAQSGADRAGR